MNIHDLLWQNNFFSNYKNNKRRYYVVEVNTVLIQCAKINVFINYISIKLTVET